MSISTELDGLCVTESPFYATGNYKLDLQVVFYTKTFTLLLVYYLLFFQQQFQKNKPFFQ